MTTIIRPGEHAEVSREYRGLRTVLSKAATGGLLAVVDVDIPAATTGPPLHIHPTSDETFILLAGALLVHLDGEVAELAVGDIVHITRGSRHTFATPAASSAHFLTLHTPGGFEEFHAAAAEATHRRGGALSKHELMGIAAGYDWQLAGPPMLPTGDLLSA